MTDPRVPASVNAYLTGLDALRRMNKMGDDSWRFYTVEALVLHYGRTFAPAPLPKGMKRGEEAGLLQERHQRMQLGRRRG